MSKTVAIIGGTGHLGSALAWRLARARHKTVIGSRSAESAQSKAAELGHGLSGMANVAAAEAITSLLIFINKNYQVDGAGIKITGEFEPLE